MSYQTQLGKDIAKGAEAAVHALDSTYVWLTRGDPPGWLLIFGAVIAVWLVAGVFRAPPRTPGKSE